MPFCKSTFIEQLGDVFLIQKDILKLINYGVHNEKQSALKTKAYQLGVFSPKKLCDSTNNNKK
jgi:hypothetical protein